MNVWVEQKRKR